MTDLATILLSEADPGRRRKILSALEGSARTRATGGQPSDLARELSGRSPEAVVLGGPIETLAERARQARDADQDLPLVAFLAGIRTGAPELAEFVRLGGTAVSVPADAFEAAELAPSSSQALTARLKVLVASTRALHANVAARKRMGAAPTNPSGTQPQAGPARMGGRARTPELVVVASSTGGPNALSELLSKLPSTFRQPILIVQHMPAGFVKGLADRLDRLCALRVKVADDEEALEAATVYVAAGGRHLRVRRDGTTFRAFYDDGPPVHSCRPAADILFESAVAATRGALRGVVLTGMGFDGAAGAEGIRSQGGEVFAQDEASSTVWGMPGAVVERGHASAVLPPGEIADALSARSLAGSGSQRRAAAAAAPSPDSEPSPHSGSSSRSTARRPAPKPSEDSAPRRKVGSTGVPNPRTRPTSKPTPKPLQTSKPAVAGSRPQSGSGVSGEAPKRPGLRIAAREEALAPADFAYVCDFVREQAAISLEPGKEYLVLIRLEPLARQAGLQCVSALIEELRKAPHSALGASVVEAMTTNETMFFRDGTPFRLLREVVLPEFAKRPAKERSLRVWCAASSTGQEPYSIAMTLMDSLPACSQWDIQIRASDIAEDVLEKARSGVYNQLEVSRGLPAAAMVKYFEKRGLSWTVKDELRRMVEFEKINLIQRWPRFEPLDLLFIRNVLIYFDVPTKQKILEQARALLKPNGILFLGSSETTIGLIDGFDRSGLEAGGAYRRTA